MYPFIKSFHSFIPYLLIAGLLASVLVFLAKRFGNRSFKKGDKILSLVTLILAHLQLLIGLVLYFISPVTKEAFSSGELMSNPTYRFYGVEHILVMVVSIALITIGYSRAKRQDVAVKKFQTLTIFYLIALVLILTRIPWGVWPSADL